MAHRPVEHSQPDQHAAIEDSSAALALSQGVFLPVELSTRAGEQLIGLADLGSRRAIRGRAWCSCSCAGMCGGGGLRGRASLAWEKEGDGPMASAAGREQVFEEEGGKVVAAAEV